VALRSFQHTDIEGTVTGSPIAAEFDWALAPLGRWRAARLADPTESRAEACAHYDAVVRNWAAADLPLRPRADTAARERARLDCR
jgi:hypothetical protein